MKKILMYIFICTIFGNLSSQNRPEFFKTIPLIDESTPDWAKLMYDENPNVAEVERLYKQYHKENIFVKTIHTQNHKHWILQVTPYLDDNGFIKLPNKTQQDQKFQQLKNRYNQNQTLRIPGTDQGWVAMGPFETFDTDNAMPISWHKNIYAIDQSMSNANVLICGTEAGGIYKSVDKGANWSLISLGEPFSGGNASVKIHPTNQNNFLIASNNRIYQSLDGGNSWSERLYTNGTGNEFQFSPMNSSIVFHTSSSGLFKSNDAGTTWFQVYADSCWDINFHPTNTSVAYLLKSNPSAKRSELYRSDDNGNTWTLKDNGWYVPSNITQAIDDGGKIAVTPASVDLVYVCLIGQSKNGDNGWIGVYKSINRGDNWTNPSGQDGSPYGVINSTDNWNVAAYSDGYHQGYYNFDMEASAVDPNKLWVGTIRLSESNDGGQTFQSIGAANSSRLSFIHADIQDIEVIGNDVWVASDGGINYSNDELNAHTALNKGIQAAHFWGFNTGWNQDTFTGGKYHDGTSGWYENYGLGNTYNIGGVEEASGYIHPIESRKMYYRTHYASVNTSVKTIPETFGNAVIENADLPIRPNESYLDAERSGVYFDPRYADHIYVGLENQIYKSTNGGLGFEVLYTFPDNTGIVYEIEISRSNPNVMYAVYNKLGGYWDNCEIWKSSDGGLSWNKTTTNPTGNNRRFRISVHPEDENKVWVCTVRGVDGEKVHYTDNGGITWQNKTTTILNGENIYDILYQGGTDDVVYIATEYGVWYWNSTTNNWINYATDLPLVTKSLQINPFYRDSELRLGTTGRGVWGRKMVVDDFNPIAQPITYSDVIRCPQEPVQFDCYSILNHEDASWQWTITPAPQSISSSTIRNPEVVFGELGSYDVTLSVTDGNGNTSTKTITNMVTVEDDCPACTSYGNMDWATAITLVEFNGISNSTGKTQAYTDYSDTFSSTVQQGNSYGLTVNLNTDGDYTTYAKAWIDWNNDDDFDDAGEAYELGSTTNSPNGITNVSPLSITVPNNAAIGETVMRVSTKFGVYPTQCETDFDGEVEDYAINVMPSLGVIENSFDDVPIIYPNPTHGKFVIDLNRIHANVNVQIIDLNGKLIQSKEFSHKKLLDLELNQATGVYLVRIASERKSATIRVLVK